MSTHTDDTHTYLRLCVEMLLRMGARALKLEPDPFLPTLLKHIIICKGVYECVRV